MKTLFSFLIVFSLWAALDREMYAQTTTVTTTTSSGTVSETSPNVITIKSSPGEITRYTSTKTTTYVDENGNPVAVETVRSGAPVTVYSTNASAEVPVAEKVVVHRTMTTAAPTSVTSTTVTETPSNPPSIDGLITSADEDGFYLRSEVNTKKLYYEKRRLTTYVDSNGNKLPSTSLRPGTPVTVFYAKDGRDTVATRVVVKTSTTVQRTTTTTTETTTVPR